MRPGDLDELPVDLLLEVVAPLLVEQVPLVVGDDQRTARLHHHRDDAGVLLAEHLAGIDEDDRDLSTVEGRLRPQRRVVVGAAGLVGAAPDAGEVIKLDTQGSELQIMHGGARTLRERVAAEETLSKLTAREIEVLACMADGLGRAEIAERLYLSPNTVRTHMQSILGKLGVHSSLAAVALGRRLKIC